MIGFRLLTRALGIKMTIVVPPSPNHLTHTTSPFTNARALDSASYTRRLVRILRPCSSRHVREQKRSTPATRRYAYANPRVNLSLDRLDTYQRASSILR